MLKLEINIKKKSMKILKNLIIFSKMDTNLTKLDTFKRILNLQLKIN